MFLFRFNVIESVFHYLFQMFLKIIISPAFQWSITFWILSYFYRCNSAMSSSTSSFNCRINGDNNTTTCNNISLTGIVQVPNTTQTFILDNNTFPVLSQDSFMHFHKVQHLSMQSCQINIIEPNAFRGLLHLYKLDLKHNLIYQIESYVFSGLLRLRYLILDHNHIHYIYKFAFFGLQLFQLSLDNNSDLHYLSFGVFSGSYVEELSFQNTSLTYKSVAALSVLRGSLQRLSIVHNNRPLIITPDTFQGFHFHELSLAYSRLKNILFLRYLTVEHLTLTGNFLKHVNFSQYVNLNDLRVLNIDKTSISKPEESLFRGLNNLETVNLRNNGIRTLSEKILLFFNKLKHINLESNHFHCNCNLLWLKNWMQTTTVNVTGVFCNLSKADDIRHKPSAHFFCTAPHILAITKHIKSCENSVVSLTCTAYGDPIPTITWRTPSEFNIVASSASTAQLPGSNTGVLTIEYLQKEDRGLYECVSSNVAGNTTASATIYISYKSRIYQSLPLVAINCGAIVTSCYSFSLLYFIIYSLIES